MKRLRHCLITLLTALLLAPAVQACGPLRLALLNYPGYFQRLPDGSLRGIDVDIAQELETRSACPLRLEESNPARLWPALLAGRVELSSGVTYLPERLADVEYLWLIRSHALVLVRQAQAEQTPSRAAFDADPSLRLGVIRSARRGEQAQAWVDQLRAQGRLSESSDIPSLLRAFEGGRVAAILLLPGTLHGLRDAGWLAAHPMLDWLPQDRITAGWAVSRAHVPAASRQRLRDAAESLRQDGSLQRLLRKHLGDAMARHYEFLPAPPP